MTAVEVAPRMRARIGSADLDPWVVAARVSALVDAPAQCEVTLAVERGATLTEPAPGDRCTVAADQHELFDGEVTAVERRWGPDGQVSLVVRAYDRLHRARGRQTVRVLERVDVEDVARAVTRGLDVSVRAVETPRWDRIVQHRQHDLALLEQQCRRTGVHFQLHGDVLELYGADGVDAEPIELTLGRDVLEACVRTNVDRACGSVDVHAWSTSDAEHISGRHRGDGDDATVVLTGAHGSTAAQLDALAQAELDRRAAATRTLWAVTAGDARLRPGVRVRLAGGAHAADETFVVASAVHTVDHLGLRCEIDSTPPPVPLAAGAVAPTTMTMGVVLAVDDPDGRGRVRLALPAYDSIETDWAGVVVPGAGDGKGVIALPAVGDTVVVLLAHDDPDHGIVLGGLYGTRRPPDDGVTGDDVRRWTVTTAGSQRMVLDDVASAASLEVSDGSRIRMAPEGIGIHAAGDIVIEAPGRNITIRAKRVDFEDA